MRKNIETTSIIVLQRFFVICAFFTVLACVAPLSAQNGSVFNRVRQLPDLGACPSSGAADPDLKKALISAIADARKQAKNLVSLAQQAKDSGLLAADKIKELSESAQKMDQALNSSSDDCAVARAFAGLYTPKASAPESAGGGTSGSKALGDGTCEHAGAPCIYQPREGDKVIRGRLALSSGAKPNGSHVRLGSVDRIQVDVNANDRKLYNPDTGDFSVDVAQLNAYNSVQLIESDQSDSAIPTPSISVLKSVACDRSAGRRPCLNTPHAYDDTVSGEVSVRNNKLDPNTKIRVSINGDAAGDPVSAKEANGKFIFELKAREPLQENASVEAEQTPAIGDSLGTTGPVRVEKTQTVRDKITVDQAALDFGHQAMQTSSSAQPVTVTNKTGARQILQLLTLLGQPRDFKVSGCQNPLESTEHCTFNVVFAPFPSNRLKLRESFVAVVPSDARDSFEGLRVKLAAVGTDAENVEEQWRGAMRCKDHPNNECPQVLNGWDTGEGAKNLQTQSDEQKWEILRVKLCWKRNGKFAGDCRELTRPERELRATGLWGEYRHQRDEESKALENLGAKFNLVKLNAVPDHWKFPFTRAVAGVDLSAPSSRTLKQSYFIDFNLLAPFPGVKRNQDPLENRMFFWMNPRITSLPQATNFSTISSINETGSFFDTNQTIDKIAKGFDVSGGIDIALVKPRDGVPWWAEYANTQAKLAPSFIIGGGMSTPFSTDSTQVTSAVTQAICDAFAAPADQQFSVGTSNSPQGTQGLHCTFNDPNSSTNPQRSPLIQVQNPTSNPDPNKGVRSFVEFYQQDRSRFFRRYYVGLRLKTYFFSPDVHSYCQPFEKRTLDEGDCAAPYDIFPGVIDLTIGQDESVTGGRTVGLVGRLDAVYPLPWFKGMHVFGSMYTRIHGSNKASQPFSGYTIVNPANGAANDLNTFRFALQPLDRDYFRIGVGVDLIQVFKKTGQPDKNAPQAPASVPKTTGAS